MFFKTKKIPFSKFIAKFILGFYFILHNAPIIPWIGENLQMGEFKMQEILVCLACTHRRWVIIFFQLFIDSGVERERIARGLGNTKPAIQIKTSRA